MGCSVIHTVRVQYKQQDSLKGKKILSRITESNFILFRLNVLCVSMMMHFSVETRCFNKITIIQLC